MTSRYRSLVTQRKDIDNSTYKGKMDEIIIDSDTGALYLYDGVTAGGILISDGSSPVQELISRKGQPDGYAPLNSSAKIPTEYLSKLSIEQALENTYTGNLTILGNLTVTGTSATIQQNYITATGWEAPMPLNVVGDVSGVVTFDGTSSSTLNLVLPNIVNVGTYSKVVVDAKGRVVAGGVLTSADIITILGYTPVNLVNSSSDITISGTSTVTFSLNSVGTPGTYNQIITDSKGRVVSGTLINPTINLSYIGDITAVGIAGQNISTTLSATGVTAGTYNAPIITVDNKGRITSAVSTNPLYLTSNVLLLSNQLNLKAGQTNSPPIKFVSGTLTNPIIPGSIEYDGTNFYITNSTQRVSVLSSNGTISSALKLAIPRIITLAGDLNGNLTFDGTTDVTLTSSLGITGVAPGTYNKVVVDNKGRITSGAVTPSTWTILKDEALPSPAQQWIWQLPAIGNYKTIRIEIFGFATSGPDACSIRFGNSYNTIGTSGYMYRFTDGSVNSSETSSGSGNDTGIRIFGNCHAMDISQPYKSEIVMEIRGERTTSGVTRISGDYICAGSVMGTGSFSGMCFGNYEKTYIALVDLTNSLYPSSTTNYIRIYGIV